MTRVESPYYQNYAEHTVLSISDLLSYLVKEQINDLETNEVAPLPIKTRKQLLRWFEQSQRFKDIYTEALRYFLIPMSDEEIEETKERLAGKLYQSIAFSYFAGKQTEGQILLSPTRTLTFYERLYLNTPRVKHRFGLDSLLGISVPDSLRIRMEENSYQISAVYEYTLTRKSAYYEDKIAAFSYDIINFPHLFAQSRLVFILPRVDHLPTAIKESSALASYIPFKHSQFRHFGNKVIDRYRSHRGSLTNPDDVSATLAEIQDFARQRPTITVDATFKQPNP